LEEYFVKSYIQIAILILSVFIITSCLRTATPDDDLASGIVLGDIAAVQQALDRGANVTRVYQDGSTPLMSACRELKKYHGEADANVTVAVKADLKNRKTSVNLQESNAHASHSSQIVKGNPEIVKLLIARGADVHAKDKKGQTALSIALKNNLPEIAGILRQAGAKE
jgi:ankyrin repeat protein